MFRLRIGYGMLAKRTARAAGAVWYQSGLQKAPGPHVYDVVAVVVQDLPIRAGVTGFFYGDTRSTTPSSPKLFPPKDRMLGREKA